jgi:hypothetical protein
MTILTLVGLLILGFLVFHCFNKKFTKLGEPTAATITKVTPIEGPENQK